MKEETQVTTKAERGSFCSRCFTICSFVLLLITILAWISAYLRPNPIF